MLLEHQLIDELGAKLHSCARRVLQVRIERSVDPQPLTIEAPFAQLLGELLSNKVHEIRRFAGVDA